jgi:hypothetical protein
MARLLTGNKNNSCFYKDKVQAAECKQAAGWGERAKRPEP